MSLAAAPAEASPALSWSRPVRVDHRPPYSGAVSIEALSCPSRSLCVGVDGNGNIVSSTHPTGRSTAWKVSLVGVLSTRPSMLPGTVYPHQVSISCPSASLCVAVGNYGTAAISTNPTGGRSAWKLTTIEPSGRAYTNLTGVSCASTSQCVAIDAGGDVLTSTDPTGGAGAWKPAQVEVPGDHSGDVGFCSGGTCFVLDAISCPTVSLCVAVDSGGDVITSIDPTGGPGSWTTTRINQSPSSGYSMTGVSCASQSLCVAVDDDGSLFASAAPTGGSSAWGAIMPGDGRLTNVACAAGGFCTATAMNGRVLTSRNPTGGADAWSSTLADKTDNPSLNSVSCPSASLCVAADERGNLVFSTNPAGAAAWRTSGQVEGSNSLTDVACPSVRLCVAVDSAGNVVSSAHPTPTRAAWRTFHVDRARTAPYFEAPPAQAAFTHITCPSMKLCVAVDDAGNVIASSHPGYGRRAWRPAHVDSASLPTVPDQPRQQATFSNMSCPSTSLCVASDEAGNIISSTDPLGGAHAWRVAHVDRTASPSLSGLSCPSSRLCVATDDQTNTVFTSRDPAAGARSWSSFSLSGIDELWSPSCPSVHLCVAAARGALVRSTHPTGGPQRWKRLTVVPNAGNAGDIACPSVSLCVAISGIDSQGGYVTTSTHPTGGVTTWKTALIDPSIPPAPFGPGFLSGVICPSASLCVVTDTGGRLLSSRRPARGPAAWTATPLTNHDQPSLASYVMSCADSTFCVAGDGGGRVTIGRGPRRRRPGVRKR